MAVFVYNALDSAGRRSAGTLTAENRGAALKQISTKGLRPVSVQEQQPAASRKAIFARSGRVSKASVEAFTRQLANLLAAGVPLSRALGILTREASQPAARRLWMVIRDDVLGGAPLAGALAKWPKSFPSVYVAMVRAGEMGGFLDAVLEQIAEFRSREQDLKGRVKAALIYPMVLAVLASGVLTFLLTYFIPRFSSIFAEFGGSLPLLTRMIIALSGLLMKYGLAVALVAAVLIVGARRVLSGEAGRRAFERGILRVPGLGDVIARFALVRFCRMLGTLLHAGVPLVTALRVAREAIGNQTLADAVSHAVEEVQRGSSLARSLAASAQLFPASAVEMVAVAEESGRLDKELIRLAASYEGELDRRLRMLVAVVEPALLFVMAGVVGTVVIGMLLPIFTLQELIH